MADTTQVGGLKSFAIDGKRYMVNAGSDVTFCPNRTKAATIMGLTGPAGYSEEAVPGFIEAEIVITPTEYAVESAKRSATVVASNAAGTTANGSKMWFTADPSYAMNAGTATVRFEGIKVDVG